MTLISHLWLFTSPSPPDVLLFSLLYPLQRYPLLSLYGSFLWFSFSLPSFIVRLLLFGFLLLCHFIHGRSIWEFGFGGNSHFIITIAFMGVYQLGKDIIIVAGSPEQLLIIFHILDFTLPALIHSFMMFTSISDALGRMDFCRLSYLFISSYIPLVFSCICPVVLGIDHNLSIISLSSKDIS